MYIVRTTGIYKMNDNSSADVLNEISRKPELHPLSTFSSPQVRHFSFIHPQTKRNAHSIPGVAGKEISRRVCSLQQHGGPYDHRGILFVQRR